MSVAYVDTSVLVAVALDEPGSATLVEALSRYDTLVTANLLEAELRSTFAREGLEQARCEDILGAVQWILPPRPLGRELRRVLRAGYLRGADLWHVATALFLAERLAELPFVTLDQRQRQVARKLGFPTP